MRRYLPLDIIAARLGELGLRPEQVEKHVAAVERHRAVRKREKQRSAPEPREQPDCHPAASFGAPDGIGRGSQGPL